MVASADQAKWLGSQRRPGFRSDWESVKVDIMYRCNLAKFEQNKDVAALLLATGTRTLVEHAEDAEWGDGGDGTGKNLLGQVLTRVRNEIAAAAAATTSTAAAPTVAATAPKA